MRTFPNSVLTKLIFPSIIFTSFSAQATNTNYNISTASTTPLVLQNGDSVTVTDTGSIITVSPTNINKHAISANNVTINAINNYGCIYSNNNSTSTSGRNCTSPRATDFGAIEINNSTVTSLTNYATGTIGQSIHIFQGSQIGSIENDGLIMEDLDVFQVHSHADSITNNGTIADDLNVYDGATVTTILNTGTIGDQLAVNHNTGVSDVTEVGTITNEGTIGRNIWLSLANVDTINNSGDINGIILGTSDTDSGILLDDESTANTINNSGNIAGMAVSSDSTIGTLNNSGDISGTIDIFDTSKITTALNNNDGGVIDQINLYDNAQISTVNNNCGAEIGGITMNNSSQIGTLNNSANLGEIRLNDSSTVTELNNKNDGCGGSITTVSLQGDSTSGIGTLNNDSDIGTLEITYGSNIDTINNNSGATIDNIALSNASTIDTLHNNSHIGTIELAGSTMSTVNNNSGATINNIDLTNTSEITTLNNTGTISNTAGTAISMDSTSKVGIINTGLISGNSKSIDYGNSNNNVLTLNPGSTINGVIDFGTVGDNHVTVNGGSQSTRHYYYDGNFILNPYDEKHIMVIRTEDHGNPEFIVTNRPDNHNDTIGNLTNNSTSDINNLITSRLDNFRFNMLNCHADSSQDNVKCTKDHADLNDGNLLAYNDETGTATDTHSNLGRDFSEKKSLLWAEGFGSYDKRASYKDFSGSESSSGGLALGGDKKISSNQRLGIFFGGLKGSTNIDDSAGSDIDSTGFFAGTYLSTDEDSYFVDLSLILGATKNDSDRFVDGDIAQSSYYNIFGAPTITIGKMIDTKLPLILSTSLRYNGQWIQGNNETGSTADIKTDGKYLNTIGARLKVETNMKSNGNFNFNVRAGFDGNTIIGNRDINVTIFNEEVPITATSRRYNVDGFVGVNLAYDLRDDVRIYADAEGSTGLSQSLSNNKVGLYGKLGVKYAF